MMVLLFYFTSASDAGETMDIPSYFGARVEHMPDFQKESAQNVSLHSWLPWCIYGHNTWLIKGSVLSYGSSQRANTSETQTSIVTSEVFLALEAEKIFSLRSFNWHVGFGVQSNVPIINQRSSQFTEREQEDIDIQLQNTRAALSYTGIRMPVMVQLPIHSNLSFGIGLQNILLLQRSESDYTTYFDTTWRTSPLLSIQIQ